MTCSGGLHYAVPTTGDIDASASASASASVSANPTPTPTARLLDYSTTPTTRHASTSPLDLPTLLPQSFSRT